jgi:glycosyltransferase involved in cell wall biosynthesis
VEALPRRQPAFRDARDAAPLDVRVLVCHNRYSSDAPSGENLVVEDEVELLRRTGVDIARYTKGSDELAGGNLSGWTRAATAPLHSRAALAEFDACLKQHKPQVVHLHNVYPLLGPGVVGVAKRHGIPVVQTVHNYRHGCVNGLLFRDGVPCTRCVGRSVPWPALTGPCYRDSLPQTSVMVASAALHRGTWRRVDAFCVLSPFMQRQLAAMGIPEERFVLRPTWSYGPDAVTPGGKSILFVGRLDSYKGVDLLMRAWEWSSLSDHGWTLRIAGAGELQRQVEEFARRKCGVEFLGTITGKALEIAYAQSTVMAIPSLLYEGLPRVFSEAMSYGRPVLVNDSGSMASVVVGGLGWTVPASVEAWGRALDRMLDASSRDLTAAPRAYWETNLSPRAAATSLVHLYERLIAHAPLNSI